MIKCNDLFVIKKFDGDRLLSEIFQNTFEDIMHQFPNMTFKHLSELQTHGWVTYVPSTNNIRYTFRVQGT